ncbi:MAG: flavodoxin domain-containing protein [Deltaproteobacteria bacterium]|nr:flavodoxin domain-containing protein [Deltaproteobacteria bacterium]
MKILVTYFSQTENTKQVAEAIHQETSQSNEVDLKKVEETNADTLSGYDAVFVGSPIHAGGLAAQVKELLEALPQNPKFKLAAFITHASSAYEKDGFEKGIQSLDEITKSKQITYLGSYDCQGRLSEEIQPIVQQSRGESDEEWGKKMAECNEHPNAEDEQKAKEFARKVLA